MHDRNQDRRWDVSRDSTYSELFNESRRFRDYQLSFTKWTISLVLAIAGAYIGLVNKAAFWPGLPTRIFLSSIVAALFFGTCLVIRHADKRFREIFEYWKEVKPLFMDDFEPKEFCVKPHIVMYFLVVMTCGVVALLIWTYPHLRLCY